MGVTSTLGMEVEPEIQKVPDPLVVGAERYKKEGGSWPGKTKTRKRQKSGVMP